MCAFNSDFFYIYIFNDVFVVLELINFTLVIFTFIVLFDFVFETTINIFILNQNLIYEILLKYYL